MPDATPIPISTLAVVDADGRSRRSLHVFCPMTTRTQDVESCVECPSCVKLDDSGASDGRPRVFCSQPARTGSPRARPVGSVLARFSLCMQRGASAAALVSFPIGGLVPLVDDALHFVGVVAPPSHGPSSAPTSLAIEEHEPLSTALTRMVKARIRTAPVVAADGTVVGAIEDLDVMRALRGA